MDGARWIKITTDMFDNRKIRQIEALPDGDSIIVIWVHLLLLAGTINDYGQIYLTTELPYTDQMLATELRKPIATVQMALDVFQRFGMIEIIDHNIKIVNWLKYQNTEGLEKIREQNRLRKQKQREKERALIEDHGTSRDSHVTVTQQNKNKSKRRVDKDLDIDKNLEKETDLEANNKTSCSEQSEPAHELADVEPVILNDGSEWRPDIGLYEEYKKLYPAVDIDEEFRKIRAWCLSNSKKRKTKSGVKRFVNSWLDRAQNSYHPAGSSKSSSYMDVIRNRVDIVDTWQ